MPAFDLFIHMFISVEMSKKKKALIVLEGKG